MTDTPEQEESLLAGETGNAAPARRFSYAFAKRHGLLLDRVEDGVARVYHRPGIRLTSLAEGPRLDLTGRIRKFRAMGHEAWCTTLDGTPEGTILVRTERPDRVPRP